MNLFLVGFIGKRLIYRKKPNLFSHFPRIQVVDVKQVAPPMFVTLVILSSCSLQQTLRALYNVRVQASLYKDGEHVGRRQPKDKNTVRPLKKVNIIDHSVCRARIYARCININIYHT